MSLSIIEESASLEESDIQESIYNSIDGFQDIMFNAGAGAGKTFALIESLKHIIAIHGNRLISHNQKIMCITYTNVAINEIKERLGNSDLVQVSTIHENLWQLIKNHQNELVIIHTEKLDAELLRLRSDLTENQEEKTLKSYTSYRGLGELAQQNFTTLMMENKPLYYNNYNKKSAEIKTAFDEILQQYPSIFKNISNFKKIVNTIFKINNYEQCLLKIKENDIDYTTIKYDSKYNSDILHRMLISHDTLLEYSAEMINRYDLLKRIIIDSFPYIMIDEYQDTSENVVKIMSHLSSFALKVKRNVFIGYFGDSVQNIYDDGIGSGINDVHRNLLHINKKFNRRSHSEIISVINKIRNDEIQQESIYSDSVGGSVKFYLGQSEERLDLINAFTQKYKTKWNASLDEKLHCLVLTNKLVAELSGFPDVYLNFSRTSFYKRFYDRLNSELLSKETSKLGDAPNLIYRILRFKAFIDNPDTNLNNLISKKELPALSFKDLIKIVQQLKCLSGGTLNELIKSIFVEYDKSEDGSYLRELICDLVPLDTLTYDVFVKYLYYKLFDEQDDTLEQDQAILESLLNTDITQYNLWLDFIEDTQRTDIVYHTYHGTKGLEFENVIIVMENDFGRMNRNKFSSFFEKTIHRNDLTDSDDITKFSNTKNLLYVSCSRAIRNLRVLYLDDTTKFIDGINSIFTTTEPFNLE